MFKTLKQHAFEMLKKNWLILTIAVFIVSIIPQIFTVIYDSLNMEAAEKLSEGLLAIQDNPSQFATMDEYLAAMMSLIQQYNDSLVATWLPFVGSIIPYFFMMSITAGFLTAIRHEKVRVKDFKLNLKTIATSLLVDLVRTVICCLGLVLFIFPGIYLAFAYSLVFYIKLDNPDMSIRQCFKRSRELMRGKKLRLFNHILSFVGWMIVAGVASMLVSEVLYIIPIPIVANLLIAICSCAIMAFVEAYLYTAIALFYEFNCVRPPVEPQRVFVRIVPDPFASRPDPFDENSPPVQNSQDEPFEF